MEGESLSDYFPKITPCNCSCQREKEKREAGVTHGDTENTLNQGGWEGEGRETERSATVGLQTGGDSAEEHLN